MKTCLRRICCNFCFILVATFSKAKISHAKPTSQLKASAASLKITNSTKANFKLKITESNNNYATMICNNKDVSASIPKKRRKTIKQADFEVRVLPNGEYTPQEKRDGNISIKKKIMIFK